MKELVEFRRRNHLTQDELGAYLGMQKSFISKIENGRERFPKDKFRKLLENEEGWDVDVLRNVDLDDLGLVTYRWLVDPPVLNKASENKTWEQKHIAMLEKRIAELEKQNEEYWDMLKQLITVVDK